MLYHYSGGSWTKGLALDQIGRAARLEHGAVTVFSFFIGDIPRILALLVALAVAAAAGMVTISLYHKLIQM